MEYSKLIAGIALIIVFTWLLKKHSKRYGFAKALFSIDIILGLMAGLFLCISAIYGLTH